MRELLGKNNFRSQKASTGVPIDFAENPQLPGTSGAATQSGSNIELTSSGERALNMVGENVNGERGVGVEKMGQHSDLEDEFPMIERQF